MNLLQLRTQFATVSGRYDLVNPTTFADNGADYYIQQGQRSLERMLNITSTEARFYTDIADGDYKATFQNCRSLREVWIMNESGRRELTKLEGDDLRAIHQRFVANLYTVPLSTMTKGMPRYFYQVNLRRVPEDEDGSGDSSTLSSYLNTTYPYDPTYTGIIMLPRSDGAYGLEIFGLFYSPILQANTDSNFWSVNHPNLLLMAAMKQLEIFYRGLKAASSWDRLMAPELENLDKDMIEEQIYNAHEMRG